MTPDGYRNRDEMEKEQFNPLLHIYIFKVNKCIPIGKSTAIQRAIPFDLLGRLIPLEDWHTPLRQAAWAALISLGELWQQENRSKGLIPNDL